MRIFEMDPDDFWQFLERLVAGSRVILDRPKGSQHPRYPDIVYPQDYGYLEGTTSGDGSGIDIWVGASETRELSAVILTVDLHKRDAEIKILLGCSEDEIQTILAFHNNKNDMRATLVRKPKEEKLNNIPETHIDLLTDEKKAFLFLATLMPNGAPQVTPVWFNSDGEYILINSAKGRVKDRNMRTRPQVALCIQDPSNPYRYMQIRGKVAEFTTSGADDHIDALALKYRGVPKYPNRQEGEQRVKYKIRIEKVDTHG